MRVIAIVYGAVKHLGRYYTLVQEFSVGSKTLDFEPSDIVLEFH